MSFYDIHHHSEFSLFDGMAKVKDAAKYAKELGYPALGNTDHGNISALIKHFNACSEQDIIPILGCEFYFQPKINHDKPSYHLCLFANSLEGWKNLNRLTSIANDDEHYYYKPKLTFADLKEHSEGIVCSSACIGGYIPQLLVKQNEEKADKAIKKFVSIFGKNFFIEIQPIELQGENEVEGLENSQIIINNELIRKAKEFNIPVIATSDSHFIKKEDFPTYLKMHAIKGSTLGDGYSERFMPSEKCMYKRIKKYHKDDFDFITKGYDTFLKRVGDSREWFEFETEMPEFTNDPEVTFSLMKKKCLKTLKEEGKTSDEYMKRLKHEFSVIKHHGFQDYFMIVQEYVNWARSHDIAVGPGRGSAGNSLVNYALGITKVDPIYFGNNFDRFLRKDKKKFPDIDMDFSQKNRDKVIQHIIDQYPGSGAQTITYGCYNIKNLILDLAKVCGADYKDKAEMGAIKKFLEKYCDDNESTVDDAIYDDKRFDEYNSLYDDIIIHFIKLYGKVRFFGTHASSVILCDGDIVSKAGLCRIGGNYRTSFDLHDMETIKLLKLDVLGLSTTDKVKELEDMCGVHFSYDIFKDKDMLKGFEKGNASVFQFESPTANEIAKEIGIDSFEDIVVATSVNRPGPLSLKMHEKYRDAKISPDTSSPWYKYTKQTYGTLIYQEQGMPICKEIGQLDPDTTDKIVKADYLHIPQENLKEWQEKFYKGAKEYGLSKSEMETLFNSLIQYSFNRGHGVAYAMLSAELMYFKVHYPLEFWYSTLKWENNAEKTIKQEIGAVQDGCIILLPHVNGPIEYGLVEYDGELVIQKGLSTIKGIGEKAAAKIVEEREKNGKFKNYKDFCDRCEVTKIANIKTVAALEKEGALDFNQKRWLARVEKYNVSLYGRSL